MFRWEAPVALFVFNRPAVTRRVFERIAAARPSRLLLIADGPRPDHAGEGERCQEVRKIISAVNWPCTLETNFSDANLGCRRRMISGLNWVFSLVEQAIILEDDCVPDPSFFRYCAELLERYRDHEEVGVISGHNPVARSIPSNDSYFFTRMVLIWGWATWRRTWEKYDEHMSGWPARGELLSTLWPDEQHQDYWTTGLESMYKGEGPDTWDYQLLFKSWEMHWLNIIPRTNLVENIGFGTDATHTRKRNPASAIPADGLRFPLHHPAEIRELPGFRQLLQREIYSPDLLTKVRQHLMALARTR
jgi:hypothetical protein